MKNASTPCPIATLKAVLYLENFLPQSLYYRSRKMIFLGDPLILVICIKYGKGIKPLSKKCGTFLLKYHHRIFLDRMTTKSFQTDAFKIRNKPLIP